MKHSHTSQPVDLLLINASNLPYEPFYPYAFIMLSARAKKKGLSVKRLELSNLAPDRIEMWLDHYIRTFRPRMIGFTLRQTDSYTIQDYMDTSSDRYFPVVTLKNTIEKVREKTDAPIVIGGYGFSLHAKEILQYVNADFGVKGCVDSLLHHFEDILDRRGLEQIPNLVYPENGSPRENGQIYYPPFDDREYDPELLQEVIDYYGRVLAHGHAYLTLYNRGEPICFGSDGHHRKIFAYRSQTPSIPIEVSRGCCFNCYFCSEPLVKGSKVVYRDLDVIEEEVRFGASYHLREFWFVCSELNLGNSDFALALAERMIKINETLGRHPVSWKAYHLPRWFSQNDFKTLYRSGFVTSWNDFVALDDQQLQKANVPYRTADAIQFLKSDHTIRHEMNLLPPLKFSIFLGDIFLTPKALSQTLTTFEHHGLKHICGGAAGIYGIRIFNQERNQASPSPYYTFTFTPKDGDTAPELVFPAFQVSAALFDAFGNIDEIIEFFEYICRTLLSDDHLAQKEWNYFLARHISPQGLKRLLEESPVNEALAAQFDILTDDCEKKTGEGVLEMMENPDAEKLKNILYPPPKEKKQSRQTCDLLLRYLYLSHFDDFKKILRFLGLPADSPQITTLSTFAILRILYQRYKTNKDLLEKTITHFNLTLEAPELLLLNDYLFRHNVVLDPRYRTWLFPEMDETFMTAGELSDASA